MFHDITTNDSARTICSTWVTSRIASNNDFIETLSETVFHLLTTVRYEVVVRESYSRAAGTASNSKHITTVVTIRPYTAPNRALPNGSSTPAPRQAPLSGTPQNAATL